MNDEVRKKDFPISDDEAVREQQFRRAVSSFEGIILSQIEMKNKLGAPGDFAQAYVIAHEVGHHVQTLLGISDQVQKAKRGRSKAEANELSVRQELQADCLSGIWARQAQERFGTLERGDLEEAVNAARQIGDDTLQINAGRVPMPHTFTHGTSAQRARWFAQGYEAGDMRVCDTFSTDDL